MKKKILERDAGVFLPKTATDVIAENILFVEKKTPPLLFCRQKRPERYYLSTIFTRREWCQVS